MSEKKRHDYIDLIDLIQNKVNIVNKVSIDDLKEYVYNVFGTEGGCFHADH